MSDYCPGAVQSAQPGGGALNTALPSRVTWHITWDALRADGSQPEFAAVSNYLKNQGYCPTIMWNPFTGYMEQFYPASQSARALVAWNEDGAVNVQIEVFFTPGCVVDGVKYATVADTPLIGFDTLLEWMDGLGVPRVWPMGAPQWQGNSRDAGIWNAQAGHYGHCNVPDNTHTDPGPMPDLNRNGIAATGTITQEEPLVPNESDKVFWPIDPGAPKESLNEVLNDIIRELRATRADVKGVWSVQATDPTDPGKAYRMSDYVVSGATRGKTNAELIKAISAPAVDVPTLAEHLAPLLNAVTVQELLDGIKTQWNK